MPTIIDGSGSADFQTPLPISEGGTGSAVAAAFGRVVRTAGDITTTSTSLVDATGSSITLTTGANPIAYGAAITFYNSLAYQQGPFNVAIDGVLQHGTSGVVGTYNDTVQKNGSFSGQSAVLAAGVHTVKLQWAVGGGTGTLEANAVRNHMFYAHEVR